MYRKTILVLVFANFALCFTDEDCAFVDVFSKSESVTKTRNTGYPISAFIVNGTCEARAYQRYYSRNESATFKKQEIEHRRHPTLVKLTDYLFSSLPPFELSSAVGVSKQCRIDSQQYVHNLKKLKMWALKMYDANAKIPSGLLSGNINQLGDFDLCLAAKSDDLRIRGQYCLAYIQVEPHQDHYVHSVYDLVYSHSPFKSKLNDPGHRVPRYSSINWALCIPDSCTSQDVELGLKQVVTQIFNGTDLEYQLKVDSSMCQKVEDKPLPRATVLSILFFGVVVAIILISTTYDYYRIHTKSDLMVAFSLRKNLSILTSTSRSPNDIRAIHGVRFVNAFILLFAHKSMALFFVPYMNRTEMSEIIGQPWTVLGRAASLYTDPFIMIAGTLTAYSFYSKLQRTRKINIIEEYVSRMFRIVPSLAALILFCTHVMPWINSGPQWNLVVTHYSDICKKHWWRNMLFIHNYFGFKNMCLTHTHHIGIDTQLFLVSPFMVLLLWKWPKRGIILLSTWAIISTVMRYYVTYTKKLSNYIHYGTSVEQLFSTADNMYILPSHRITVYVMGILLGCLLQSRKNIRLNSFQLMLGNTVALFSFCGAFFGPAFMGDMKYVYKPADAAWYAAFAPILWCLSFAWVIFATHNGYSSGIGRFLSWRGFIIWTRLSYAIYLIQFPTFFYNVGTTRTSEYYGFFSKNFNLGECLWIVLLSVLLTVMFELPLQNLKTIFLRNKTKTAKID